GGVDQGRVGAVDGVGLLVLVRQEALDHVEDEERSHPVVREALPHLGEEQREEAGRMAEQGVLLDVVIRRRGGHRGSWTQSGGRESIRLGWPGNQAYDRAPP